MIFDEKSQTILYDGEDARLAAPFATWVSPDRFRCLVPAKYSNLPKLAALDLDVPDPMRHYEWPSQPGSEPFPTQKLVSSFLTLNPRAFVVSDVRTGKTRASLWAADWLMQHSKRKLHCLIVSDIKPISMTWAPEIGTHFLGRRTFEIVRGTATKREAALSRDADFYLTNPEGLIIGAPRRYLETGPDRRVQACFSPASSVYRALIDKKFDIIIFDEATSYRNDQSQQSKAARVISREAPYVWLLTGTPVPNGPLDAFGLKRLCQPGHKLSYKTWRDRVTIANGPFRRDPKPEAATLVDELLQPSIRITQDQCFKPTKLHGPIYVDCALSSEQKHYMRELKRELLTTLESGAEISAVSESVLRTKLIQIACGVVYDKDHGEHILPRSPRLERFKELVTRLPGKLIVFAPFVSVIKMLGREFGPEAVQIRSGSTRQANLALLANWQTDPGKRVLLSHPGPVSRGIDLTEARTIIWYSPCDRTEHFIQANERINGVNQKKERWIVALSGCSIERDIYEGLRGRQKLLGAILRLKQMEI